MAALSSKYGAWGNGFADFNNDGYKDAFTANAHVNDIVERFEPTTYKQANSVFANLGNGRFEQSACPAFAASVRAHRGNAFADFNSDGKLDVVVSALGEPAELWENTSTPSNHWLIVKLRGTKSNRDGIGAVLRIGSQVNEMSTCFGYASSSHAGVHFGLGTQVKVPVLEIRWPSGLVQTIKDVGVDQVLKVIEP
jgi:hypothetical protein